MKTIKKLLAFLLVVMMLASVCSLSAFALDDEEPNGDPANGGNEGNVVTTETVTIKVHADDSYSGAAADNGRTFQWHRVFTATYVTPHSNTSEDFGEGDAAATPFDLTSSPEDAAVAYIASNAVAAKLGTWAEGAWTRAEGNDWFDLYPAVTGGYVVKWVGEDSSTAAQAAARWLLENEVYEASGALTYNNAGVWSADVVKGYFLVESSVGENLIAATTDIDVYEKNTYPSVDKQEKDADQTDFSATQGKNQEGENAQTKSKVAVGDIIDYTVTVHVPANANADIVAYDIMSKGLELVANSLAVTINGEAADTAAWEETTTKASLNPTWEITIHPTKDVTADPDNNVEAVVGTRGKDVVIAFKAKVTADALTDSGRRNDATIEYDNFEADDYVEYTTYFTGIEKVDGASVAEGKKPEDKETLKGVKFNLQAVAKNAAEGTEPADFKVSPVKKGGNGNDKDDVLYYVPDANGSSEVVTDKDGLIKIRGLDNDKTYTLTETEAAPGYNVMQGSITLALMEDTFTESTDAETGDVTTTYAIDTATFAQVLNNKGTELPSTGGIGTTIFYVVGGLLLVGAGVLLITKKRMEH